MAYPQAHVDSEFGREFWPG